MEFMVGTVYDNASVVVFECIRGRTAAWFPSTLSPFEQPRISASFDCLLIVAEPSPYMVNMRPGLASVLQPAAGGQLLAAPTQT